jgi:hypothetical protein
MSASPSDPQLQAPADPSARWSAHLPGPLWSSLAAIVLLAMTVALVISFQYYKERRIETRLARFGARCETKVVAPDWLRRLVDDTWLTPFRRINVVFFNREPGKDVQLADEDLAVLDGLTEVEHLSLNRTRVTDDALAHVEHLHSLKILRLVDTEITDDGLEHVAKLTHLNELDLFRTQVSHDGLKQLRGLSNLQFLRTADEDCRKYLAPGTDPAGN